MSGGAWIKQNKVRPGVYINFRNSNKMRMGLGERGVVTMPVILPWGKEKTILEIRNDDDLFEVLGIDLSDESSIVLKEALKKAAKVLIYRLNEGKKATMISDALTVNAKYSGSRGNDITITIQPNIDNNPKFEVITSIDGKQVDKQLATNIEELKANKFVEFSGNGELKPVLALHLANGTDGDATNENYIKYLEEVEVREFNTIAISSKDNTIKALVVEFVKRLRDKEGKKVQAVLENYPQADYEGVISVKNGVILKDGTVIPSEKATAWVAAATASANINESLTYSEYEDAIDIDKKYTNKDIELALRAGEFVFSVSNGRAIVEQDINTLVAYNENKGQDFRKNRVIRVLDGLANDLELKFERFYLGKIANDDDGRNLLKAEIIKYLDLMEKIDAISKFDSKSDIEVLKGSDKDCVLVNLAVQPVDSIEKIYMTVEVK